MNFNRQSFLSNIPEVVKNLLIINVIMLLATMVLESQGVNLTSILGIHHFSSPEFQPYQLVTYMFMHGNFMHLFFNMFALYMFGKVLETVWGPKRFLLYYMVTGVGAAIINMIVQTFALNGLEEAVNYYVLNPTPSNFELFLDDHGGGGNYMQFIAEFTQNAQNSEYIEATISKAKQILVMTRDIPTVGASGSVFGILLAFGMLFPNTQLMLLIPPIPIKAKYFVIIYGAIELYSGISNNPGDNVAHFAHLGGMLFGYFLIQYWKKDINQFN
jgi:membrane associated rhomboid family serine protease